jgi:CheY-like chemotaxis protein
MVTTDLLVQLGYQVIETDNPKDALTQLKTGRQVDLLFTDVVMPGGMDGFALVKKAHELYPGLKVLLTSGYSEFGSRADKNAANFRVIGKPFRQSELAHALRDVLDA